MYLNVKLNKFKLQKEEVAEVKWLTYEEFAKLFYSEEFVSFPNDYREKVLQKLKIKN